MWYSCRARLFSAIVEEPLPSFSFFFAMLVTMQYMSRDAAGRRAIRRVRADPSPGAGPLHAGADVRSRQRGGSLPEALRVVPGRQGVRTRWTASGGAAGFAFRGHHP